eukprot:2344800-Prymnesium_polylepis.1
MDTCYARRKCRHVSLSYTGCRSLREPAPTRPYRTTHQLTTCLFQVCPMAFVPKYGPACGDGTGASEQGRRNSLTTLRGSLYAVKAWFLYRKQ